MHTIDTNTERFKKAKAAVTQFIYLNKREPLINDFNSVSYLPSVKTIQRRFGSLTLFRNTLGLKTDYKAKGATSKTMRRVTARAKEYERKIHEQLVKKYHDIHSLKLTVEREVEYQRYGNEAPGTKAIRSDSAIVNRETNHIIFFDFFYPSTKPSFLSCIRVKRNKFRKNPIDLGSYTYENIFVCVNPEFKQEEIDNYKIERDNFKIYSHDTFIQTYF